MVRSIPKDGRVVRIKKETLEFLAEYDTDVNAAISKIQKVIAGKSTPVASAQHPSACKFEEKKLRDIVESAMEKVLKPFIGGQ